MKTFIFIVLCLFMPWIYLGFIYAGLYTPLSVLYKSAFEHYKSDEPFGPIW